jgi:predicted transcriptional regulator
VHSTSDAPKGSDRFSAAASEVTAHLLRIMGCRGGWTVNNLIERSGLVAKDVNAALTFLELDGLVRKGRFGFDPARSH